MAASQWDAHDQPFYGARFRIIFPLIDLNGTPLTGATGLDSEVSQDSGIFADCVNEAIEIGTSGFYYLDLVATETDTKKTVLIVKTTTTGARPFIAALTPQKLPVIRSNTVQNAPGATSITLDPNASALDEYYTGCWINITINAPTNALGQCRRIIAYNGTSKIVSIENSWGTNPTSASSYEILGSPEWLWRWADVRANQGSTSGGSNAIFNVNVVSAAGTPWGTNAITAGTIADGAIDRATFAADTGLQTIRSGTCPAQSGPAGTSITLDASASTTTGYYVGAWIQLTGAGASTGQVRLCTAYDGTTRIATVTPAWAANPVSSNTFVILPAAWVGGAGTITPSGITDIWQGTTLAEGYAADGAVADPRQLLYMIWSKLAEMSISGVTMTCKKLDGSTTSMTFTLDSATPTSITRAS